MSAKIQFQSVSSISHGQVANEVYMGFWQYNFLLCIRNTQIYRMDGFPMLAS